MTTATLPRMLTPPEAGKRLRVKAERVIGWIRSGQLRALDLSSPGSKRPRFRIDPADLAVFENSRAVITTPKRRRRRKGPEDVIQCF